MKVREGRGSRRADRRMPEGRRYLGLDIVARCRINLVPATEPEIGSENLPALIA